MEVSLGGSKVVGNPNSLEIESLARFAVEEHNKKQNTLLEFRRVVSATTQVVAGISYNIKLEVNDGWKKQVYEARIWEKSWLNFKELQEFKLVGDAPAPAPAELYLNLIAFALLICPCLTCACCER